MGPPSSPTHGGLVLAALAVLVAIGTLIFSCNTTCGADAPPCLDNREFSPLDDQKEEDHSIPSDAVACQERNRSGAVLLPSDTLTTSKLVGVLEHAIETSSGKASSVLGTLANRAAFTTNQNAIREAGGLGHIMHALDSTDKGTRRNAVWAFSNLSLNDENHVVLSSAAPRIAELLLAEKQALDASANGQQGPLTDDTLLMCMRAVMNLVIYPATHATVIATGILPHIGELLAENYANDVRLCAVKILTNMSMENPKAVIGAGIFTHMVDLLHAKNDPQWLVRVLALLGNTLGALIEDQSTTDVLGTLRIVEGQSIATACSKIASATNQESEVKERAEKAVELLAGFSPSQNRHMLPVSREKG